MFGIFAPIYTSLGLFRAQKKFLEIWKSPRQNLVALIDHTPLTLAAAAEMQAHAEAFGIAVRNANQSAS